MQGSLTVLGHVGPMACSKNEASEGWLLSGPLLRGFLSWASCLRVQGTSFKAERLSPLVQLVSWRDGWTGGKGGRGQPGLAAASFWVVFGGHRLSL